MKTSKTCLIVSILAFASAMVGADAAVIFQTVNQTSSSNLWTSAIWGTPAAEATAGNSYVTDSGFTVRTNASASSTTFGGDSLTLRGTGMLITRRTSIANYIMEGGTIAQALNTTIGGTLFVASGQSGVINGNSRTMTLSALISGDGILYGGDGSGSSANSTVEHITNADNTFSGTWIINGGRFNSAVAGALDAASFSVTGGTLDIDYAFGGAGTTSALSLSGSGFFDLSNGFDYTFASVSIGGASLAPGTYAYSDLTAAQQGFFVDGSDTFTVIPEPGTLVLLCGGAGMLLLRSRRIRRGAGA